MSASRWKQALADLREELALIESSSKGIAGHFQTSAMEAECCKIEVMQHSLDRQCRAVARQRGWDSVFRDKRKLGTSLAVGAAAAIIGGLATKDKYAGLNTGLASLDGTLRGLGNARWLVSLGSKMFVVPWDYSPTNGKWVTLESLGGALMNLKAEALQGRELGTFDDVVQRLLQSRGQLVYLALVKPN